MSTLLNLRTQLESILASELGTYTLANGVPTPAVRCSDPSDGRAPGTKVSGIELVIEKQPELLPIRQYSQEFAVARWTAYIVAWGDDKTAGTSAQLIVNSIPGCELTKLTIPDGVGPRDQIRLSILTPANALGLSDLVPGAEIVLDDLVTVAGDPLVTIAGDQLTVGAFA